MIPGLLGKVRVGAHVEVFKTDENGKKRLVHTSRPGEVCGQCGAPVGLLAVASSDGTVHCPTCRKG